MSAQEDYERLEKALLELENDLKPSQPRSRKTWTPRDDYRIAFRKAIQEFWQSTWSISGVDEKTTMREAFWGGDDPSIDMRWWFGWIDVCGLLGLSADILYLKRCIQAEPR